MKLKEYFLKGLRKIVTGSEGKLKTNGSGATNYSKIQVLKDSFSLYSQMAHSLYTDSIFYG